MWSSSAAFLGHLVVIVKHRMATMISNTSMPLWLSFGQRQAGDDIRSVVLMERGWRSAGSGVGYAYYHFPGIDGLADWGDCIPGWARHSAMLGALLRGPSGRRAAGLSIAVRCGPILVPAIFGPGRSSLSDLFRRGIGIGWLRPQPCSGPGEGPRGMRFMSLTLNASGLFIGSIVTFPSG